MVTCHWTHWSLDHLAWDVAVFASLTCACACRCPRRLAPALALSVFAIPAAVFVFQPELATYRGLSGIDSALLMLLLIDAMKQKRGASVICAALLAAFIAKLLYEQVTGTATFVDAGRAGFVPVPLAHLVGAVAGAAAAAFKPRRFP
jgi:rhomboid family GlyGly-CTERM serine protease